MIETSAEQLKIDAALAALRLALLPSAQRIAREQAKSLAEREADRIVEEAAVRARRDVFKRLAKPDLEENTAAADRNQLEVFLTAGVVTRALRNDYKAKLVSEIQEQLARAWVPHVLAGLLPSREAVRAQLADSGRARRTRVAAKKRERAALLERVERGRIERERARRRLPGAP